MNNLTCAGTYTSCNDQNTYMGKNFTQFNTAVNTYGKLYDSYIANSCNSNINSTSQFSINLTNKDFQNNTGGGDLLTSCKDLNQELMYFAKNINVCATRYSTDIKDDKSPYNSDKNAVLSSYAEIKSKRAQLDQDVLKVLASDNSPIYEKQGILDSAVYTTLLWTVLATSTLYYAFTKI